MEEQKISKKRSFIVHFIALEWGINLSNEILMNCNLRLIDIGTVYFI